MSKMGVYGFLRILLPIFFREIIYLRTPLLWLAVITVVFSSYVALVQTDLKRIFAYSSINHLGYCMLGIFAAVSFPFGPATITDRAATLNGVIFQMFNHGLTASTMFWFVALLEKRSGGLRGLNDFGGLRKVAPIFSGLMGIAIFSSLGLPGLNGFVGEFLILKGVFALAPWAGALSILGLGITAIFLLTIIQRVFSGPLNERWSGFPDLTKTDQVTIAIPIVLMFIIGIYPQLLIRIINDTTMRLIQQLGAS
jgi:NADH-quinone oxidoreductase subunit M